MKDWHDTPTWDTLTTSQKLLYEAVIGNAGNAVTLRRPDHQLRNDIAGMVSLGVITSVYAGSSVTLTAVPYQEPPVRIEVTKVDFAVPGHYDIGPRFRSWDAAVAHARNKITVHRYAGQKLRPEAPDFHPKRHVQNGDGLLSYSRAFVQMRVVEPVQERGDGAGPCGSDGVVMTWEVFKDGTVEAHPDDPSPAAENTRPQTVTFSGPGEAVTGILLPPTPSDTPARLLGVTERGISISELLREKDVEIAHLRKEATELVDLYGQAFSAINEALQAALPGKPPADQFFQLEELAVAMVNNAWNHYTELSKLREDMRAVIRAARIPDQDTVDNDFIEAAQPAHAIKQIKAVDEGEFVRWWCTCGVGGTCLPSEAWTAMSRHITDAELS